MSRPTRQTAAGRAYLDLQNRARREKRTTQELLTLYVQISTATVKLKLDINIGDPVTPAPQLIELLSQRPGTPPVRVLGYPIETVLAEKTSTAIALGEANTRVRDYADLHILTGKHMVPFATMRAALQATMRHRGVAIRPLSEVVGDLATLRQDAYDAFRRRLGPDGSHLPGRFSEVVADTIQFVDPITDTEEPVTTWSPTNREWQ